MKTKIEEFEDSPPTNRAQRRERHRTANRHHQSSARRPTAHPRPSDVPLRTTPTPRPPPAKVTRRARE